MKMIFISPVFSQLNLLTQSPERRQITISQTLVGIPTLFHGNIHFQTFQTSFPLEKHARRVIILDQKIGKNLRAIYLIIMFRAIIQAFTI